VHFRVLDEATGVFERIKNADDQNLYAFDTWMIGNLAYTRVDAFTPECIKNTFYTFDEKADNAVSMGFQFDPTDVSVEYANCLAEVRASLWPIKVGIQSYADGISNAKSNMKAAGIDRVVVEYQKQLTEWIAAN